MNQTFFYTFYLDSIYSVIALSLIDVHNELFRAQFRKEFDVKYLRDKQQDTFKDMTNADNPLVSLMKLDKKQKNSKSDLVRDLIELVCEKIKMTREELLDDTFEKPKRPTLIYCILFDQSFVTLPVHVKTIEQLSVIWKKWEIEGFLVTEINTWNNLARPEQETVCRIWNIVAKYLKNSIQFQQLVDQAKAKIGMINEMIENAGLCIKELCQDTWDKDVYFNHLRELQERLNNTTVNAAIISPKITELGPFVDRIKLFIPFPDWQEYLKRNLKPQTGKLRSFHSLISLKLVYC